MLHLTGMLMDTDVYSFSRELKALAKTGTPKIIVDLSKTDFIDSHGLGVLVFHYTSMQREGKSLIILNENTNPASYINGLLKTTGMINVLKINTNKASV